MPGNLTVGVSLREGGGFAMAWEGAICHLHKFLILRNFLRVFCGATGQEGFFVPPQGSTGFSVVPQGSTVSFLFGISFFVLPPDCRVELPELCLVVVPGKIANAFRHCAIFFFTRSMSVYFWGGGGVCRARYFCINYPNLNPGFTLP